MNSVILFNSGHLWRTAVILVTTWPMFSTVLSEAGLWLASDAKTLSPRNPFALSFTSVASDIDYMATTYRVAQISCCRATVQ